MARFNKMQVLEAIGKTGMVPVFYHADADVAEQVESLAGGNASGRVQR